MLNKRQKLGKRGEDLALDYLKRQGYKILSRNFRCKLGEIDIIGRDGKCLAFIEVKTRSGKQFGSPGSAVDFRKQAQISRVAQHYLLEQKLINLDARFDVIGILLEENSPPEIELIKNAFDFCG